MSGLCTGCEIHFEEVCDTFDYTGSCAPNWNAGEGDQHCFIAVSEEDVYSYTSFLQGAAVHSEDQQTDKFTNRTEAYLTDSFAHLILGEIENGSLAAAGEAAHLFENGRPTAKVIRSNDAGPYLDAASRAKTAALHFVRKNAAEVLSENGFFTDKLSRRGS